MKRGHIFYLISTPGRMFFFVLGINLKGFLYNNFGFNYQVLYILKLHKLSFVKFAEFARGTGKG